MSKNLQDRRQFLVSSALSLSTAALSTRPLFSDGRDGGPSRKFFSNLSCGRIGVKASFSESLEFASQHGFEAVDPDADFFATLGESELKKLLEKMQSLKLRLGSAGLPVEFRESETVFRAGLEKLPQIAAILEKAGVTRLNTWILSFSNAHTYLENFRIHTNRLRQCAEILAGQGQRLGLEYVGPKTAWRSSKHPFIHTLSETCELIAAISHNNVGVQLDSWHWFNAEETENDLLSLKNEGIVAVDVNDAPAGVPIDRQQDSARELPLATGVIPLATFFRALRQIGYDGPVSIEPFNAALRAKARDQAIAATAAAMQKVMAL